MTPEPQDRNPFVSIAILVVVMAVLAGLTTRFGLNSLVAALCVAIAIIGTWVLLSPQTESLEPAISPSAGIATHGGQGARGLASTNSAFSGKGAATRQRLRSAPRAAVGFGGGKSEQHGRVQPSHLPALEDNSFADSVAPVQALGQLPQDAGALTVTTTVEPSSNISGAYTLGQFEIRAASRRGSDHVILDDPRHDDYVVASAAGGRYLVVVVADGQTSAENSQYGSYWASRLLAQAIDQHLRDGVPGIEKMLERTRDDLSRLFDMRFTDGTKMRTIATTLVGLIAPVDGGPAAGFRVGGADILVAGENGWGSLFGMPAEPAADAVFPRSVEAQVAPLEFDGNCLLLASDGVSGPIATNQRVAQAYAESLRVPVSEVEFDQLMSFPLEEARGDRTAVGVWFSARR